MRPLWGAAVGAAAAAAGAAAAVGAGAACVVRAVGLESWGGSQGLLVPAAAAVGNRAMHRGVAGVGGAAGAVRVAGAAGVVGVGRSVGRRACATWTGGWELEPEPQP